MHGLMLTGWPSGVIIFMISIIIVIKHAYTCMAHVACQSALRARAPYVARVSRGLLCQDRETERERDSKRSSGKRSKDWNSSVDSYIDEMNTRCPLIYDVILNILNFPQAARLWGPKPNGVDLLQVLCPCWTLFVPGVECTV